MNNTTQNVPNPQMRDLGKKRRREFVLETSTGIGLAYGVLYDQGNCSIMWRGDYEMLHSNGACREEYQNIGVVLNLIPAVSIIRVLETTEVFDYNQTGTGRPTAGKRSLKEMQEKRQKTMSESGG